MIDSADKLFVVVDQALPPGARLAQAVHGALAFAAEHPEVERAWRERSNTVAVLACDGGRLPLLLERAEIDAVPVATFREPDLGDRMTAVVLGPGARSRRLVRNFPLAE